MVLKARSIVSISMIEVTASNTMPSAVSRAAFSANCCMYTVIKFDEASGTRLAVAMLRSVSTMSSKTGNAVTTVSMMVISGTSASSVVKVRLPHSWKQRSSLNRRYTSTTKFASNLNWRTMSRSDLSRSFIGVGVWFRRYNTGFSGGKIAMQEILVLYYSHTGAVKQMAQLIARGVEKVPGMGARLRTAPKVSTVTEATEGEIPDSGAPYV